MNWEQIIKSLLLAAAVLELACIVICLFPAKIDPLKIPLATKKFNLPPAGKTLWSRIAFIAAWIICLIIFAINYHLAKAPPFGNMYQVMSFMPIILAPLYLYVSLVQNRTWLLGYFAATSMIALIGAYSMPFQANWSQMPALQSVWFVPHVAAYVLSYALATAGTLLALVAAWYKIKARRMDAIDALLRAATEEDLSFLFKAESTEYSGRGFNAHFETGKDNYHAESAKFNEAAYGMILLSFPFMSFGLWSGAIWADEVWGGYWGWDIKEAWSLVTWGLYLIYFHIRKIPKWKDYQRPVLYAAYIALLITFLVVNLLPKITSMHSYAT